jgi:hypothetical protein
MDFAGIGVALANHGHPEYWGDMERLARNHLAESQVRAAGWLGVEADRRIRSSSPGGILRAGGGRLGS